LAVLDWTSLAVLGLLTVSAGWTCLPVLRVDLIARPLTFVAYGVAWLGVLAAFVAGEAWAPTALLVAAADALWPSFRTSP
jgi:hypothetical protein